MAQVQSQRLRDVHAAAMLEFDNIQTTVREGRMEALQDRRFYSIAGAQWEGTLGAQFENKPKFEMNKIHLSLIRIFNEYRNNRITVDFLPKDGETGDKVADVCNGLYRADEQDSTADEAYDNAFEEAVGGGMGAWRLCAEYEDEHDDDNDRQRIKIVPQFDADSTVFFDLDAKRQDKADAKRCYLLTPMSPEAYKETWKDDPATWDRNISQTEFDWSTNDTVWVCELYKVEEVTDVMNFYRGLIEGGEDMKVPQKELDDDPEKEGELIARGFRLVRQKKIKSRKVRKYILSGSKVLKDEGYIAGKCIPVVPTYGKRWYVDNIERFMGHVRLAKDAQRLKNMQISNLAELAALSGREKPIFDPSQMAGHEVMWAEDNVKNYPYMLANSLKDDQGNIVQNGPIGYTKPPAIPPALVGLLQQSEQDMQDLLGNQQAGEQLQPNQSGKAVELIQNRLDMQVFIYMSNLSKAMKRSGEIWLSMMKDIMVEDNRRMKVLDEQGGVSSVVMNQPAFNAKEGTEYIKNDLSDAALDVSVDVGPSSASRRGATVRALTGMLAITQDPETRSVLESMAMMNMEGEGLSEAREFFRNKMVKMGVIKPTEEEAQALQAAAQNQQPDPNTVYLQAAAEEAQAGAAEKRANTVKSIADADLKGAQRIKTLVDAGVAERGQQVASTQALHAMLQPPSTPPTSSI